MSTTLFSLTTAPTTDGNWPTYAKLYMSAKQLGKLECQSQSESGPLRRAVELAESLEYLFLVVLVDASAGVGHDDFHGVDSREDFVG